MDDLQKELVCEETFKGVTDNSLPTPEDQLVKKFFLVIKESTKSHSKRPTLAQVSIPCYFNGLSRRLRLPISVLSM